MGSTISSDRRPVLSEKLEAILAPCNRLFDWLYHSRYSPLYRSGTLVAALFIILLVTGLYLIFFYSVSKPYQSLEHIQSQVWLGRWIRAVHRYATDAALAAVFFHLLQILVQGKTWGPRILAWLSGVVLLAALLISAWTGYVMVWDQHGQRLAVAGAQMLQVLPFLRDVLAMAFNGSSPVDQGFFFMNLFLHVGIPLLMVFGLWVHTARLARADWFPQGRVFLWLTVSLIALGILWSAPLTAPANLLTMIGAGPLDWMYGFWLPVQDYINPLAALALLLSLGAILTSVPWWWRLQEKPECSNVDPETCSGCTQCARDCPYEAIRMVPHPAGKRLYAQVDPYLCVSCAICAASCDDRAIGPPQRTAIEQVARAESFLQARSDSPQTAVVALTCEHNGNLSSALQAHYAHEGQVCIYPLDCCGTLHSDVLGSLLTRFSGACIIGCPEGNCRNRDGLDLLRQRIFEKRVPFLPRSIDRDRIKVFAFSEAERTHATRAIEYLRDRLAPNSVATRSPFVEQLGYVIRRTLATAFLLFVLGAVSQFPYGSDSSTSLLRVAVQIPGRSTEQCRELTEEEKQKLPKHMQRPQVCETTYLDYALQVSLGGVQVANQVFTHSGFRGDSPILVNEDIPVQAGEHLLKVRLEPVGMDDSTHVLSFEERVDFEVGKIRLMTFDSVRDVLAIQP